MRDVSKSLSAFLRISAGLGVLALVALLYFNSSFFHSAPGVARHLSDSTAESGAVTHEAFKPPIHSLEQTIVGNANPRQVSDTDRVRQSKTPLEAQDKEGSRATASLSGEEARRSIDWRSVRRFSAIPRAMPAAESDDPLEAGFAPEWVERAMAGWIIESPTYHGKHSSVAAAPAALPIVSEKKRPDDTWAYAVEYELRRVIRANFGNDAPNIPRVFCNAHGCLCYFEGMTERDPLGVVTQALTDEAWTKDFGIDPLNIYWMNGGVGAKEFHWQMILVMRHSGLQ